MWSPTESIYHSDNGEQQQQVMDGVAVLHPGGPFPYSCWMIGLVDGHYHVTRPAVLVMMMASIEFEMRCCLSLIREIFGFVVVFSFAVGCKGPTCTAPASSLTTTLMRGGALVLVRSLEFRAKIEDGDS